MTKWRFRDSQIVNITNFVVVSSVGIKRVVCNEYPYKPQIYYIKTGFMGSKLYRRVFAMQIVTKLVSLVRWRQIYHENQALLRRYIKRDIYLHLSFQSCDCQKSPLRLALLVKISALFVFFFIFYFYRKWVLIFHANRQYAWNIKSCFLGKIRKNDIYLSSAELA